MFLALLAVYLIAYLNYDQLFKDDPSNDYYNPRLEKYKDMDNNLLENLNYCGTKSCLAKCCGKHESLDYTYTCRDEKYFLEIYNLIPWLGEDSWNETTKKINKAMENLNSKYALIQRVDNNFEPIANSSSATFYLFDFDGSLVYTRDSTYPPKYEDAYQLYFCLDYRISFPNATNKIELVFQLDKGAKEKNEKPLDVKKFVSVSCQFLGGGMLVTVISLLGLVCCLPQIQRRYVAYIIGAYSMSLTCAYALKILHLYEANITKLYPKECKSISVLLYFILLSAFCWPLIFTYNVLSSIRNLCLTNKVNAKVNIVTIFRYCTFGWGLPLLITVIAIAVDKSDLDIQKPPFNSCFQNENVAMLYLNIPISILIIVQSLLYVMYAYDMWVLKSTLQENPHVEKIKSNFFSTLLWRKLLGDLLVLCVVRNLPNMPGLLCITLYCCCFLNLFLPYFMFLYQKNIFVNLHKRLIRRYQNMKFTTLKEGKEYDEFSVKDGKIAIISNMDFETGTNTDIHNSNLEKNVALFCNVNLDKDEKDDHNDSKNIK